MEHKLNRAILHITSIEEYIPDDKLIDIFQHVNFMKKHDQCIIFEKNNFMQQVKEETIAFRIMKIPDINTDIGLIELFDIKEDNKIVNFNNLYQFYKRMYD
jgi:hypothetical protein